MASGWRTTCYAVQPTEIRGTLAGFLHAALNLTIKIQPLFSNCDATTESYRNSGCGTTVGTAPLITPRSLRDRHPFGSSNALSRSNTDALQYKIYDICKHFRKHINNTKCKY